MSAIDRVTALAARLALLVAFSFAGYILGFGLGEQSGDKKAKTDTYAQHAQDEINSTCAGFDGSAQTECIVSVVEATNEHKRSQADLNAQRNMAKWALLILIATIAMAIVTAFGVYYVWRTLAVTREIGEAQVRAYIGIPTAELRQMKSGQIALNIAIQNSGNSPARNPRIVYGVAVTVDAHVWPVAQIIRGTKIEIGAKDVGAQSMSCEGLVFEVAEIRFPSGDQVIFGTEIVISYDTVFKSLRRQSEEFTAMGAIPMMKFRNGESFPVTVFRKNKDGED